MARFRPASTNGGKYVNLTAWQGSGQLVPMAEAVEPLIDPLPASNTELRQVIYFFCFLTLKVCVLVEKCTAPVDLACNWYVAGHSYSCALM